LHTWSRALLVASTAVIALGSLLVLAPSVGGAFFNVVFFSRLSYPVPFPPEADAYIRVVNGVLGAVMIGWMVVVIRMARGPFRRGQLFAWNAIAWSIGVWFVVDTTFSLASRAFGNALLNLCTAAMFAVPLAASRRYFGNPDVATSDSHG
jgi:hypothetical protein